MRARIVYQTGDRRHPYTKPLLSKLKYALARALLCMAPANTENDTQDFRKSCVSFFKIRALIHKLHVSEAFFSIRQHPVQQKCV